MGINIIFSVVAQSSNSHLGRYYYLCHDELSCPSPAREYTPRPSRRPRHEIEAEAESIHQRRDDEAREQEHRSAANALYEGALGALPAGYGNNGLTPVDASVARAFSVLPSQPRSQNDVNNPVVAHQPPRGDETPPPGGGSGVVAVVQGGGDGVAGALAYPGGGVGVLAAAVLAPPGGRPAQRARAATAALQRQIAAGAAPTSGPTVISTGEAVQIRRGRAPDLNGTVISLNGLMDRARGMIETSIGGSRSVPEPPNTKRQRVRTANIAC